MSCENVTGQDGIWTADNKQVMSRCVPCSRVGSVQDGGTVPTPVFPHLSCFLAHLLLESHHAL